MSKLSSVPLEALMEELAGRADEAVLVIRIRPKVLGPNQAPTVISAGKGDVGDQLGLTEMFKLQLRSNHAQQQHMAMMQAIAEQQGGEEPAGGPR